MPRFTRIDARSLRLILRVLRATLQEPIEGLRCHVRQHGGPVAVVRVRVARYGQIVRIGRSESKEQSG